jgi:hypothetical protein
MPRTVKATANAERRAEELTALVEARLPSEHTATGDHDAWPLIAEALLSRMTADNDTRQHGEQLY